MSPAAIRALNHAAEHIAGALVGIAFAVFVLAARARARSSPAQSAESHLRSFTGKSQEQP